MNSTANHKIFLLGYGGQGRAWAHCFREKNQPFELLLRKDGPSWQAAQRDGYAPLDLSQWIQTPHPAQDFGLFLMLISDLEAERAVQSIESAWPGKRTFIFAFGLFSLAKWTFDSNSTPLLFAPKAIGPKIRESFDAGMGRHNLCAAVSITEEKNQLQSIQLIADLLGFQRENLLPIEARLEAMGDLLSEQWILCGTLLTFLQWTEAKMLAWGIDPRIVRAECIEELGLIANLLKERGSHETIASISETARLGVLKIQERLDQKGLYKEFEVSAAEIESGYFVSELPRLRQVEQSTSKKNPHFATPLGSKPAK